MGDPAAPELDLDRLVDTLNEYDVEFVVVGGIAAREHGARRTTRDLDVCPRWNDENLSRLAAALSSLGARLRVAGSDEPVDFPLDAPALRAFEVSTWRTPHGDLDVIVGIPDAQGRLRRYDNLVDRASPGGALLGQRAQIAALDDIIESKERLAREPDIAALPELRALSRALATEKRRDN